MQEFDRSSLDSPTSRVAVCDCALSQNWAQQGIPAYRYVTLPADDYLGQRYATPATTLPNTLSVANSVLPPTPTVKLRISTF